MSSGAPHDERAQVHRGDQPHPPSPLSEKQLTQQKYEKATRALMSYFQQRATSAHRLSMGLRRLAARFGSASTAVVAVTGRFQCALDSEHTESTTISSFISEFCNRTDSRANC